jgi:hypothetical protein
MERSSSIPHFAGISKIEAGLGRMAFDKKLPLAKLQRRYGISIFVCV